MRGIIKYPGSKWRISDWILSYFPKHHSYLEPFFGSGAVFFSKQRSNIETINDLDEDVVNLFHWVQHDSERLAHEIYYTPYSRQIYDNAFLPDDENSLDKAVKFLIRLNMGYGYRTTGAKVGWKNDVQGREKATEKSYSLDEIGDMSFEPGTGRGAEVDKYIKDNNIKQFVIFDDEDWDWTYYGLEEHWCRSTYYDKKYGGLQPGHIKKAIQLLD